MGQLDLWQVTQDAVDSYLSFETGQGCPYAIVQPVSEGEVPVWLTSDVKLFRIYKLFRITVGRGKAKANKFALLDLFAGNVNASQRNAPHLLDRAVVAK